MGTGWPESKRSVAQRLLALAAGVWFNWQLGVPDRRSLLAFDH